MTCNQNCNQGRNCACKPPPLWPAAKAILTAAAVCFSAVAIVAIIIA